MPGFLAIRFLPAALLPGLLLAQAGPDVKAEKMSSEQKEKVEKLIAEGDKLKKEGKVDEAAKKYQEAIDEADKGLTAKDNPNVKEGGKQKSAKAKYDPAEKDCGSTDPKGNVSIGDRGIHFRGKPSAGWLRSTKGHEYVHYSQICDRWGEESLNDCEAYQWELDNAEANGLSAEEKKALEEKMDDLKNELDKSEKEKVDKGDYTQPCTLKSEGKKALGVLQTDRIFVPDRPQFEEQVFSAPAGGDEWLVATPLIPAAILLSLPDGGDPSNPAFSTPPGTAKIGSPGTANCVYRLGNVEPGTPVRAVTADGQTIEGVRITKQGDYVFRNQGKVLERIETPSEQIPLQYAQVGVKYQSATGIGGPLSGTLTYQVSQEMVGKKFRVTVADTSGVFNPAVQEYTVPIAGTEGAVPIGGNQVSTRAGEANIQTRVEVAP